MDIVVAYDIADTAGSGGRRLRDVAAICERFGSRVQLSVFECRVSPASFAVLLGELADAIDAREDSIVIYRFAGRLNDARMRIGRGSLREVDDPWII